MSKDRDRVPTSLAGRLWRNGGLMGCAAVLVAGWAVFLLQWLFGDESEVRRLENTLIVAVALTVGCIIVGVLIFIRVRALARRGVEVTGQITFIASWKLQGTIGIRFRYRFDGRDFEKKASVQPKVIRGLAVGSEVLLIVDPAKPSRCSLMGY
jgi:hypothetical protein